MSRPAEPIEATSDPDRGLEGETLQGQRPALPPEDSTASSLTYDNWFTLELPEDIREEFRHLDRLIAEREAKERADEPQPPPVSVRPWLVDRPRATSSMIR